MFELRTCEARSATALDRKVAMFNGQEMGLFRSLGMPPYLRPLGFSPVR